MLLGTLLVAGGGRWVVLFPVMLPLFEIKIHIEERLMLAEFLATTRVTASLCPGWYPGCAWSAGTGPPSRWPPATDG
jgi:hypothetical protein